MLQRLVNAMNRPYINALATLLATMLVLTGAAAGWQVILATLVEQPRMGAAVSIVGKSNFRYDSAFIWSILVSTEGLEAMTGFDIDEPDHGKSLSKVGDWVAASSGPSRGRVVATFVEHGRELRLVFEPDSAAGVMHKRFLIATAGNGCVLQYWSQFSDFEPGSEERADKSRQSIVAAADAFRALVESRIRPHAKPRTSNDTKPQINADER